MLNLYNICLLRAFEHIHMEFARYKCLLLLLLLLLYNLEHIFTCETNKVDRTWREFRRSGKQKMLRKCY